MATPFPQSRQRDEADPMEHFRSLRSLSSPAPLRETYPESVILRPLARTSETDRIRNNLQKMLQQGEQAAGTCNRLIDRSSGARLRHSLHLRARLEGLANQVNEALYVLDRLS